ncbi:MAG TPA: hypothetical protein VFU65_08310 [Actinocrinis sp.]|nr:hypothetical protein [Actinocrinis sp.]
MSALSAYNDPRLSPDGAVPAGPNTAAWNHVTQMPVSAGPTLLETAVRVSAVRVSAVRVSAAGAAEGRATVPAACLCLVAPTATDPRRPPH